MGTYNRLPFSLSYLFIATRAFSFNGADLRAGDDVQTEGVSAHRLRQLYETRKIAVKLDDQGHPILRGSQPAAVVEPVAADITSSTLLQPGQVEGVLTGAVNAAGEFVALADLPEEDLRKLGTELEIDGAADMPVEALVAAIQAEPAILELADAAQLLQEGPQEPAGDEQPTKAGDDASDAEKAPVDGPEGEDDKQTGGDDKQTGDDVKESTEDDNRPAPRFHAEHRGSGRWYVIDSTTKEPVTAALKKDQALAKAVEMNG